MSKSWNIPGFDVYDPSLVLYAPLWRPDMVARGGSIKNGTGTMDVNPQALAVGANTITVTAAGTLIVAMPEGGTVASGTMTVTGSPVTVAAGIATTITTTGAIGNITVTPSNIIRSKDRNNRVLTVAGATWGYQGRTYVSGDTISMPQAVSQALTGQGGATLLMWLNITSTGADQYPLNIGNESGVARLQLRYVNASGSLVSFHRSGNEAGAQSSNSVAASTGIWVFAGTIIDVANQTIKLIVDTSIDTLTGLSFPDSTYVDSTHATTNIVGQSFAGTIGDFVLTNRVMTDAEALNIRLQTRWRCQ